MNNHAKPHILITGGTSGIGAALVERLAPKAKLLITGSQPLSQCANKIPYGAIYVQADQKNATRCVEIIDKHLDVLGWTHLDCAILNAGTGVAGDPLVESLDEIQSQLDVNVVATMALTHALFPRLAKGNYDGGPARLVLIGSQAHGGAPSFATYSATKGALHGLGRSLHGEWSNRICVQTLHPGPTRTPMHQKAGNAPKNPFAIFFKAQTMAMMIETAIQRNTRMATLSYIHFTTRPWLWFKGGK